MSSTRPRPTTRALTLLAVLALLVGVVGVWGSGTADATSYRYWSYWLGSSDGWHFATQGAGRTPPDGSVDGWRFAVSEASSSTVTPRRDADFSRICQGTPPVDGKKRVGLVVDFGTSGEAPQGESPPALITRCVVAPDDANGYEVLAAVVSLRTQDGLICGMNGYPATECGAPVADPPDEGGGEDGGSDPNGPDPNGDGGSQGGAAGGGSTDSAPSGDQGGDGKQGNGDQDRGKQDDKPRDEKPATTPADSPSPVAAPAATGAPPATDASGSPAGVLAGVALIAGIAIVSIVVRRRRS